MGSRKKEAAREQLSLAGEAEDESRQEGLSAWGEPRRGPVLGTFITNPAGMSPGDIAVITQFPESKGVWYKPQISRELDYFGERTKRKGSRNGLRRILCSMFM